MSTLRSQLGCWLHERIVTEWAILGTGSWLDLCNRNEQLRVCEKTGGRICEWRDSSQLSVSRIFPSIGSRLLHRCLDDWPLQFANSIASESSPDATFLVPFGGQDRKEQLLCCLASLMGQEGCRFEIIVIEQTATPTVKLKLPEGIRHLAVNVDGQMQFNKSWLFNVGARQARGRILLLHDADMIAPAAYARRSRELLDSGLDAIRPGRFIFYLNQEVSKRVQESRRIPENCVVDAVIQNNPTPLAVTVNAYRKIGGHCEAFQGWGAEDLEFLERLRTTTVSDGAFIPFIHLWHPEASGKLGDKNMTQFKVVQDLSPELRIAKLKELPWGGHAPLKDAV